MVGAMLLDATLVVVTAGPLVWSGAWNAEGLPVAAPWLTDDAWGGVRMAAIAGLVATDLGVRETQAAAPRKRVPPERWAADQCLSANACATVSAV